MRPYTMGGAVGSTEVKGGVEHEEEASTTASARKAARKMNSIPAGVWIGSE
jgi:hypothetical protein